MVFTEFGASADFFASVGFDVNRFRTLAPIICIAEYCFCSNNGATHRNSYAGKMANRYRVNVIYPHLFCAQKEYLSSLFAPSGGKETNSKRLPNSNYILSDQ